MIEAGMNGVVGIDFVRRRPDVFRVATPLTQVETASAQTTGTAHEHTAAPADIIDEMNTAVRGLVRRVAGLLHYKDSKNLLT